MAQTDILTDGAVLLSRMKRYKAKFIYHMAAIVLANLCWNRQFLCALSFQNIPNKPPEFMDFLVEWENIWKFIMKENRMFKP